MNKDEQRKKNREAMPETAKIVDDFRALFGEDTKLVYAEENGKVVRSKDDCGG